MSRQRLTLELAAADVPKAEALLTLAGAETIALRDAADDPVFEPEPSTAPLWPNVSLRGAVRARRRRRRRCARCSRRRFPTRPRPSTRSRNRRGSAELAQPVKARAIGTRLWLAPADDADVPSDRLVVRINMGLAFGTGEHPTTALCLEWLERHIASGMTVLDYGCGSGILALAALALGARFAYAVDNDPQALTATARQRGAERCHRAPVRRRARAAAGRRRRRARGQHPRGPARRARADVRRSASCRAAWLVLSGILAAQAARVAAAYAPYLEDVEHAERDGWVRLAGRRKAG